MCIYKNRRPDIQRHANTYTDTQTYTVQSTDIHLNHYTHILIPNTKQSDKKTRYSDTKHQILRYQTPNTPIPITPDTPIPNTRYSGTKHQILLYQTPDTPIPNTRYSYTKHQILRYQTPDTQIPNANQSDIRNQTLRYQTPDILCQTPDILYQTPDIQYQTPDTPIANTWYSDTKH